MSIKPEDQPTFRHFGPTAVTISSLIYLVREKYVKLLEAGTQSDRVLSAMYLFLKAMIPRTRRPHFQ